MPQQSMRFLIRRENMLVDGVGLLEGSEEARFQRFLFSRVFKPEYLLSHLGRPELLRLTERQRYREREIENEFYSEYKAFRDRLFNELVVSNPAYLKSNTKGRLLRLAQRILDRCLFIFYCEDMGQALSFPPQLLRDYLISRSMDEYFDPKGTDIWERIRTLFGLMDTGGIFPPDKKIGRFNGGLFRQDAEIDGLRITNHVFCDLRQGENEPTLSSRPDTLLYLCATYNYADQGGADKTLGLYTLGRIFEQSITELEIKEAEVDGRESLNKLSKRKTDGVYYTPEWVVETLVAETLGPRLQEMRVESGWKPDTIPSKAALEIYWEKLKQFKVVDPACGSGAFLITVFRYLRDEFALVRDMRYRLDGKTPLPEERAVLEDILANNIYGVDINPASVEISKLALWLHTARPNEPLSALDNHILDGNSLVGKKEFYTKDDLGVFDEEKKEAINAFDWQENFKEVFQQGGFDAVIGNPPYVKLQNFKRIYPEVDQFLREGRLGKSYYESTKTGNFDLYLPFIEKGLSLLNANGRMGFIAPSLWLVNEYGEGLRRHVHSLQALDRWIDFKSYQVFEEATTYTALQFFSKRACDGVRLYPAPDGEIGDLDWQRADHHVPYSELKAVDTWLLLPRHERVLITKLKKASRRLDHTDVTKAIIVGIQTSADEIYHLKKLGPGRYLCSPKKKKGEKKAAPPYEVQIEDALMKPLVSGGEAERYLEPDTNTYLLFPYIVGVQSASLIPQKVMETQFPKAWRYLKSYEKPLRLRERNKFDDAEWYRFGRHQNLDKQEVKKYIVPRLVLDLKVFFDNQGKYYLDNVDVGGVIPAEKMPPYFLLAVLNSKLTSFVFRRISKPFRGDYRSANKQFIAPLPIPKCDSRTAEEIGQLAQFLQTMVTERRALIAELQARLGSTKPVKRPEELLLPQIGTIASWLSEAPPKMPESERQSWAKEKRQEALDAALARINEVLKPGAALQAVLIKGELKFLANGIPVIEKFYVDKKEANFLFAQWDVIARTTTIGERAFAKGLVDRLRSLIPGDNKALVEQVIELRAKLAELDDQIAEAEADVNQRLYRICKLTEEEVALVEKG